MRLKTILLSIILMSTNLVFSQQYIKTTSINNLPKLIDSKIICCDYDHDGDYDIMISGIDQTAKIICKLYKNNGDTTFSESGNTFSQVYNGDLIFLDYNNDNYSDIIVSGKTSENIKITSLYKNNTDGTFTKINTDFDSVAFSAIKAADFDNDGDADILISGYNNNSVKVISLFRNDRNDNFTKINIDAEPISNGNIAVADFNNDGLVDFATTGTNNQNVKIGNIYFNRSNLNFELIDNILPKYVYSDIVSADFNNDGFADIAIAGSEGSEIYSSKIFVNNQNETFTDVSASLTGLYNVSINTGDIDNDGDIDIVFQGLNADSYLSVFYKNNGNFLFQEVNIIENSVAKGDICFFDLDNDKDLDFFISGETNSTPIADLYKNTSANLNTAPSKPVIDSYINDKYDIILSWHRASDSQTGAKSLKYNLTIGTVFGSYNIHSPNSDLSSGFVYNTELTALTDTFFLVKNLSPGKYYWQVQAIDNNFTGSKFSDAGTFVVCGDINIGNDTAVCLYSDIALNAGGGSDIVNWYSDKNGLLASNSLTLNYNVVENDIIRVNVTNSLGCSLSDTINISAIALPESTLPSDTVFCKNSNIELQQGSLTDSVNWYSASGSNLFDSNYFTQMIYGIDTIFIEIISEFGCKTNASMAVDTLSSDYFNIGNDTTVCNGSFIDFEVTNFNKVNWFSTTELLLENSQQLHYNVQGTDTVICQIFNNINCPSLDTLIVFARETPAVNAGNDTTICFNTGLYLGGHPAAEMGTPPYNYKWITTQTVSNDTESNPYCEPQNSSRYILNVTDIYNCTGADTVYVTINPQTTINFEDTLSVCVGQGVFIGNVSSVSGSLFPYVYNWTPDSNLVAATSAGPAAYPTDTTTYRLIVSTYYCEPDTAFVTVNVLPAPIVIASEDVYIGIEENVTLFASGAENYEWTPDLYVQTNNNSESIEVKPEEQITYFVTGTNAHGCKNYDSVNVFIKNDIFIPNLSTPNNDGNNDYFKVYGLGIDEIYLVIYDKNGQVVFQSNDKTEIMEYGWDGTFNGNYSPEGSYIWTISGKYLNGSEINYNKNKGIIMLKR